MPIVLGLDIGTTSISLIAIDEQGCVVDSITRSHQAQKSDLPAGYSEQSLSRLQSFARRCVAELVSRIQAKPIAVGLTGQMHGFLLLDQHFQPVTDLINWQDQRCEIVSSAGHQTFLQELNKKLPDTIRNELGCTIRRGYAVASHYALQQLGQLPSTAQKMADITGYFSSQLTGQPPQIDPTFAASWGLYHLRTGDWAGSVLQAAGLRVEQLPQLVESGAQAGLTHAEAVEHWGLPAGIPVFVGIGDNQASVCGSLEQEAEELLINIGTGGQVAWVHSETTPTDEIEIRPYLNHQFLHVGAGVAGGEAYSWLMRTVGGWLSEFDIEFTEAEIYRRLEIACQKSQNLSNNEQLICTPFFKGTRANPALRGEFQNIGSANFSLGHLTEAVLSGIVDQLLALYERSPHQLTNLKQIVTAGNFFHHHSWIINRIADRSGLPVRITNINEQAAYGAARQAFYSYAELG